METKVTDLVQTQDQIKMACNICTFTTLSAIFKNRKLLTLHFNFIHLVGENRVKCAIDRCKQVCVERYICTSMFHQKDKVWFKCDEIHFLSGEPYKCDKKQAI